MNNSLIIQKVVALAMVAGLAEASLVKSLVSTAIGLLITVIGTDPIGAVPRLTFGSQFIGGGFPFLPVYRVINGFGSDFKFQLFSADQSECRLHEYDCFKKVIFFSFEVIKISPAGVYIRQDVQSEVRNPVDCEGDHICCDR